jgi:hypothetical protein
VTVTSDPDAAWRRPSDEPAEPASGAEQGPAAAGYAGPPRSQPPPPRAAPIPVIQPLPPPRSLPPQDHDAIDAEEQRARAVTLGLAIVAAVLAVLLLLVIALRAMGA